MSLFGKLVRTTVNVATLPVAVVHDVVSLAGAIDNNGKSHTAEHLERIKREAEDPHDDR
jgi:hypothetical protein